MVGLRKLAVYERVTKRKVEEPAKQEEIPEEH